MLDAEENTIQVNGLLSLPVFKRHLEHATHDRDACVIDQHMHATKSALALRYHTLPLSLIGDVMQRKLGLAACLKNLRHNLFAQSLIYIGDQH